MKIADLPPKFLEFWGASASPSFIRNIPVGSQIGITNGAASLADGFPPLNFLPVGSGGVPPFGQDMNGILKQITQWSRWQNAGGLVPFDPAFAAAISGYPFGAMLLGAAVGVVWLSTIDDNTANPDTGGANWINIGASSSAIMAGVDTGAANVVTANVTPVPTAYADGQVFIIQKAAAANNGPMTGNIDALGSHPIVNMDGSGLTGGQWPASATGILEFNNATSSFRLLNPAVTVAPNAGLAVTAEQVLSLSIPSLPAPTGALSLADSIALQVVSDGAAREVTIAQLAAAMPASLTNLRVFLASGNYVPTPGAKNMLVFATGGGGAGGSAIAGSTDTIGGGGNAGGTALFFGPVSSQPITIGAGGAPNPTFSPLAAGGTGGTTSLGALAVATGGSGGLIGASSISLGAGGQTPGVGTVGSVLMAGGVGSSANGFDGGSGGSSFWSGGGFAGANQNPGTTPAKPGGTGSLGGGGGGADGGTVSGLGGPGGAGVVVIFEFE